MGSASLTVRGPYTPTASASEPVNVSMTEELDRIYREFAPVVYRAAWGVLGSREDAEDVVQTVFIALMRRESLPDSCRWSARTMGVRITNRSCRFDNVAATSAIVAAELRMPAG